MDMTQYSVLPRCDRCERTAIFGWFDREQFTSQRRVCVEHALDAPFGEVSCLATLANERELHYAQAVKVNFRATQPDNSMDNVLHDDRGIVTIWGLTLLVTRAAWQTSGNLTEAQVDWHIIGCHDPSFYRTSVGSSYQSTQNAIAQIMRADRFDELEESLRDGLKDALHRLYEIEVDKWV